MLHRVAIFGFISTALLFAPQHAWCREKTIRFRLDYTTVYGGIKRPLPPSSGTMPKLGLALAGGGGRAAASIGVLKVLEREGIPLSAIAGTSMGALVGGLYAAGYGPDEMEQIFTQNDWNDIFTDTPARAFLTQEQKEAGSRHLLEFSFDGGRFMPPSGLSAGQKLAVILTAKTLAASFQAGLDFNKLKVPFRAVAADIETGEAVVLDRGLLHDALRASSAIPLVFQPVEIRGRLLVDGGMVNNLPVDVARSMGADAVIAVDPSAKPETREHLNTLFDIMSQSITLQVRRETVRQAALADLVIAPDTEGFSFADFHKIKDIIRSGEEAAAAALPRIREIMRPKAAPRAGPERYRITSLDIRGNRNVPDATIRYAMAAALSPREATADDVLSALAGVFGLGYFDDLTLDLEKRGESYHGVLLVAENPVVKALAVSGNDMIPSAEIASALEGQIGATLNTAKVTAALERIVEQYRKKGYPLVYINQAGMNADDGVLKIVMNEGRIDAIRLEGRQKTRTSLLRRETKTRVNEPLNIGTMFRDIQHLYGLDYFESLAVDMAESPKGGVVLTLKVKEKPTSRVRLGLRYDLEDSFTGLTDIVVDNITGRGIKVFLNTRYGNYADVALGYHSPVFLRSYFMHTVQAFYRDRRYFIYENKRTVNELDITRIGAEFAFGYQWFRFGETFLRYRYSSDDTAETLGLNPPEKTERVGSLALLSTIDTRDSHTFAHTGMLFKGSYESAAPAYGSTNEFTKTSLSAQGFLPIGDRHTVILEASAGFGSGTIPYHEKFGIGGADYLISIPLMGYQRREFVGNNELGFSLSYQWRILEYQLNVVKGVYLTMAGQAANVWDSRDAMTFKDLRGGAGVGLHADTVVGPFKLDFGFGEDRRFAVYFSAGFEF